MVVEGGTGGHSSLATAELVLTEEELEGSGGLGTAEETTNAADDDGIDDVMADQVDKVAEEMVSACSSSSKSYSSKFRRSS